MSYSTKDLKGAYKDVGTNKKLKNHEKN